jgi:hypothetical protein
MGLELLGVAVTEICLSNRLYLEDDVHGEGTWHQSVWKSAIYYEPSRRLEGLKELNNQNKDSVEVCLMRLYKVVLARSLR